MKIYVFTDQRGDIIGSFRPKDKHDEGDPSFKPTGRSLGQVHEVDMPDALAAVKDPAQLHQELAKLIPHR